MTFRLIFTADLHGNESFYRRLLKKAEEEKLNAIVIGGDICPKGFGSIQDRISHQKHFLEDFMIPLFKEFKTKNKNCEICIIMGNDDFRVNQKILENSDEGGILKSIHNKSIKLNSKFNICGYSFVNITPFRLKDWEKPDFKGDKCPLQMFDEVITSTEREDGTIEEDLNNLAKISKPGKTVYLVHCPPHGTNLDVITTGQHVGSKSLRKFIETENPFLTLHGHIHESPQMSGFWKDKINNTFCINVGSSYPEDKLNCVIINIGDLKNIEYFELK